MPAAEVVLTCSIHMSSGHGEHVLVQQDRQARPCLLNNGSTCLLATVNVGFGRSAWPEQAYMYTREQTLQGAHLKRNLHSRRRGLRTCRP